MSLKSILAGVEKFFAGFVGKVLSDVSHAITSHGAEWAVEMAAGVVAAIDAKEMSGPDKENEVLGQLKDKAVQMGRSIPGWLLKTIVNDAVTSLRVAQGAADDLP